MLGVVAYIVKYYIYIYTCVCVCVYIYIYKIELLIFGSAVTAESNINNFSIACIYIIIFNDIRNILTYSNRKFSKSVLM